MKDKKEKQDKYNETLHVNLSFDDALKATVPPQPEYEWKVGFKVIVDKGEKERYVGTITDIDGTHVIVKDKHGDFDRVEKTRLTKK
ncbi:MAG: hypothetical protein IH795_00925 [Bacteroidetes bacterium]|nr:hypothetical protein [Bacteroidota bacterium]